MSDVIGGAVGLLGKCPAQGDFLHVRANHAAFVRFDEWLATSFEWAVERGGNSFLESYARGSIHAFVFQPPGAGSAPLTGALGPSSDSAGRKFPLVLASMLSLGPNLVRSPHLLPLLLEEFWAAAGNLVAEASFRPTFDLDERSRQLAIAPELDVELALASYGAWTHDMPLHELWQLLGEHSFGADPATPLRFLAEAVRPLAGREQPSSPLTLRLPLGRAGGAALCFWLDLIRRLVAWRATVPSFFWSHDGQAGGLMLHLGQAPVSTLSEMWQPSGERDEVCDLTAPLAGEWISALPALAPRVRAVLDAGDQASVADLLAATDSA
jgi:type VI secretion system ImpM family protein